MYGAQLRDISDRIRVRRTRGQIECSYRRPWQDDIFPIREPAHARDGGRCIHQGERQDPTAPWAVTCLLIADQQRVLDTPVAQLRSRL
jgi:hypothetical protein